MIIPTYSMFRNMFATSSTVAPDGYFVWPVANVNVSAFTGLTKPRYPGFPTFPVELFATGVVAADAVRNTDDYHWYISQRTDDPAKQYLVATNPTPSPTQSFSGTLRISMTSLGSTLFPTANEERTLGLFRHVDIYVKRISDGKIQHVRPIDTLMANLDYSVQ